MTTWEVDGSRGEGGGQLLRTSLALAAVQGRPVRVHHIRARRPKPGLARSHLAAVEALAHLTAARVEGASVGSQAIAFRPGPLRAGRLELDIGTAGSITLVLQAVLPGALRAPGPVTLDLRGGTDVPWSPPADYFLHVFLPLLGRLGIRVEAEVLRRGYYPRGGGRMVVQISPMEGWPGLHAAVPRGPPIFGGALHAANLPGHIPRRMHQAVAQVLGAEAARGVGEGVLGPAAAEGQGGAAVLWADLGGTVLGSGGVAERGLRAEDLGRRVALELLADVDAGTTLDPQAADQLLPYLALAAGPSTLRVRRVTDHLATEVDLLVRLTGARITTAVDGAAHVVQVQPGIAAPPPG